MQHPDEGTIHAWLDGALSANEGRAIEAHLAECADCRAAVVEARGLIAGSTRILLALDSVPGGVLPAAAVPVAGREPAAIRRTPLWRSVGWRAAAAIVLVGSVSWLVTRSNAPADVSTASPVAVSYAPAESSVAGTMAAVSAPRNDRLTAEVAGKAIPPAAPTRELARVTAADALERGKKSSDPAGEQAAVVAAEPNAGGARSAAPPAAVMLDETVVTMGKVSGSSALASERPHAPPLAGCYTLETSPASYAASGETFTRRLLPPRMELIDTGAAMGRGRGTVLAPPPAATSASRLRGGWTSLGANLLELRIGDGARSVTATLSVVGDSVTGQAHADSGTVADRRPSAVKGRRTSCKAP